MQKAWHRVQSLSWLLLFWFVVVGIGVVGGFSEFLKLQKTPAPLLQPTPTPTPLPSLRIDGEVPEHSAHAVWIFDRESQSLLYEDHAQTATQVASLAKLMTALVSYESYSLDTPVRIGSASAVEGNRAKFLARDVFSVSDLLHAMLIFSANDAATALANADSQGYGHFIRQMNERASQLNLPETHFVNSSGIDSPEQFSSAQDLGRLADTVLRIPFLADIVSQQAATVRELQTGRRDVVYTTNNMLRRGPQFQGVKTGTTEGAGENLIFRLVQDVDASGSAKLSASRSAELGQRRLDLIFVLLGSQARYTDAVTLSNWILKHIQR